MTIKLPSDEHERLAAWVTNTMLANCPTCGVDSWTVVGDELFMLPHVDSPDRTMPPLEGIALGTVGCRRCGVVFLINPRAAGLARDK